MIHPRILIYGDVNLNYRDGSAIWLQSLARALQMAGAQVDVLLKADVEDSSLLEPLLDIPELVLHTPFLNRRSGKAGLPPREAARRINAVDRSRPADLLITRGFHIASHVAASGRFDGRFWAYLTEGAIFDHDPSEEERRLVANIVSTSRHILVQTEQARSVVEALVPTTAGKTLVFTPVVPDEAFELAEGRKGVSGLSMVYAGKFAQPWKTLEMVQLPSRLMMQGLDATLTMVGDKIQNSPADATWASEMQRVIDSPPPGVEFLGGLPRSSTLKMISQHQIGLCWRDPELDASHEISTKLLEYAAAGTAPVVNRTAMHEQLLGKDYPLFVDDGDVLATLSRAAGNQDLVISAQDRAKERVRHYSMAATSARLETQLERTLGRRKRTGKKKHKVLLAGHDFKFAGELMDMLRQHPDFELRIDKWHRLNVHDEKVSRDLAEWADTVICEWCGPNAVFYSQIVRPDQRLLIRFHGFEIRGKWLNDLRIDHVDAVVFVSDFYRKSVLRETAWPERLTTVIPNAIDALDLDRPKSETAQFTLGMAGWVPMLKRPDRALDLLKILAAEDDRFRLRIRGRMPWNYPWEWNKPAQREAYEAFFERLATDTSLSSRVTFEPFGPDMGSWFRGIGWMLSPSTRETFHLAPVEGLASGAIPVVWEREGASEIFGSVGVLSDTVEASEFIMDQLPRWSEMQPEMKRLASQYDVMVVQDRWFDLIEGEKGSPIELHGVPLLHDEPPIEDGGTLAESIRRLLSEDRVPEAVRLFNEKQELLPSAGRAQAVLRDRVAGAAALDQWIKTPKMIFPPAGLDPVLVPRGREFFVGGDPESVRTPIDPSVRGDQAVHLLADSIQRNVRRAGSAQIVVSDTPGPEAIAASIAGRRLGIPVRWKQCDESEAAVDSPAWNMLLQLSKDPSSAQPRLLSDLRVGLIADEFTRTTIGATLPALVLGRKSWRSQLEAEAVDAVIVESAWEGVDKDWFHGIAYHGEADAEDLFELLSYCRAHDIPTIFWNKEDPVHFRSFQVPAASFDYIFTTDAARLSAYMETPGTVARAFQSLPFFVSPHLHGPVGGQRWSTGVPPVAFAGSFYGDRYRDRSEELEFILKAAAPHGLRIYDRQFGIAESPYQFPDEFRGFTVPSVPYSAMGDVYRRHAIHINVNSVRSSPSMFSRRMVEVAASGSLVLSGVGDGVENVLGESFPVLRSPDEWEDAFDLYVNDVDARKSLVVRQFLAVMRAHRADQAMAILLRTAGISVNAEAPVSISDMVGGVDKGAEVDAVRLLSLRLA